jgi:hypothetical protein
MEAFFLDPDGKGNRTGWSETKLGQQDQLQSSDLGCELAQHSSNPEGSQIFWKEN